MSNKEKKSAWQKIVNAANRFAKTPFMKRCTSTINGMVSFTWSFGYVAGVVAWLTISALAVTALPLFLQIGREQNALASEKNQIERLRQRGYTNQQISMLQAQSTIPM